MTVPTSTQTAAAGPPRARKSWVTPVLVRMNGADAENSAQAGTEDGAFTVGS